MKKILSILVFILVLSGCNQTTNEYDITFSKKSPDNNVFKKEEVDCIFHTTQMISGKPNYTGSNPLYDNDSTKEGFEITNYPTPTEEGMKIKLIGLNSETPKIKGNSGEDQLVSLNGNKFKISTKLFLEKGPAENDSISAYNISENGSIIWIKTYDMVEPFSIIQVGYCE